MKVLFTGGGTGGHIYPALAIAEALRDQGRAQPLCLLYVGTGDRLEAKIVPKTGIPIAYIAAAPLQRSFSPSLARTILWNAIGLAQALVILQRFRPDCVVATGGYVTFPVVMAMWLARRFGCTRGKIGLLEPNARPGLTNRLLEPLVDEMWVAYNEQNGVRGAKTVMTGTPVRSTFSVHMDARQARARFGLDLEKATIVVMGGSQGARSFNAAVASLVVPDEWQVLHIGGQRGEAVAGRLGVVTVDYLDDPWAAYAAADVVVARAGASTLAELAATHKPAILVPYPYATDAHQMHNAGRFVLAGAARVIVDKELDAARLLRELQDVLEPQTLAAMRKAASTLAPVDAGERIARRVVALVTEK